MCKIVKQSADFTKSRGKEIKHSMGQQCRFFLVYQLVFLSVTMIGFIVVSAPYFIQEQDTASFIDKIINSTSGFISLIALLVCTIYVIVIQRKRLISGFRMGEHKPMSIKALSIFVVLLFSCQPIFSLFYFSVESIANNFGFTSGTLSTEPTDIYYLIYAALLGPLMEEVIFRGIILNGLSKHGKTFAIITSSIIFAIYHGAVAQSIFAFFCGIILGYVGTEYSFKWATILHIFNNLVLASVLPAVIQELPLEFQQYMNWILIFLGAVCGVLVILVQRHKIMNYCLTYKAEKGTYKSAWTSLWFVITILIGIGTAVSSFSQL